MKTTTTMIFVLIIAGVTFVAIENENQKPPVGVHEDQTRPKIVRESPLDTSGMIRASGRIEGLSDQVEVRARISEQILAIDAKEGDWVRLGDRLVQLDTEQLVEQQKLADAQLRSAKARLERVHNGYRDSEVDASRSQYNALASELEGAKKNLERVKRLAAKNAESDKTVDDHATRVATLAGQVAAAKSNLETFEAPPRSDELNAAIADVAAAESQLAIAKTNLRRASIVAPMDGRVLSIEGEIGELTGPDSSSPLVILADTTQLRAMAEVDEYDALRIELGQRAYITADSAEGVLAEGVIVEIDPLMNPKQTFGQWAGERQDAYTRPVWILLEDVKDLPVGLPVDVYIHNDE